MKCEISATTDVISQRPTSQAIVDEVKCIVYKVPFELIDHAPSKLIGHTHVLCQQYNAALGCPCSAVCAHYHVKKEVLEQLPKHSAHANREWESIDAVPYKRHEAGRIILVAQPHTSVGGAIMAMPSERVIVTHGSEEALHNIRRVSKLCSHFEKKLCCLGSACNFIHVAHQKTLRTRGRETRMAHPAQTPSNVSTAPSGSFTVVASNPCYQQQMLHVVPASQSQQSFVAPQLSYLTQQPPQGPCGPTYYTLVPMPMVCMQSVPTQSWLPPVVGHA